MDMYTNPFSLPIPLGAPCLDAGPEDKRHQLAPTHKHTRKRTHQVHMGVSKNRGTPKWMVYNGKPY